MQSVRYMVSCRSFPAWRRGAHTARRALVFCFWRATCAPRLARRKVGTAVPSRPRSSHHVEGQRASVLECGAARCFEAESTNQLCRPFRAQFSYRSSNPGLTPRATICRTFGAPRLAKRKEGTSVPSRLQFSRHAEDQRDSVMECGSPCRFRERSKAVRSTALQDALALYFIRLAKRDWLGFFTQLNS